MAAKPHKEKKMEFITFIIGVVLAFCLREKTEQDKIKEEFNRGYDYAVECMTKYHYWNERDHGARHYGEWIPKDE
jgi:hypothetical protein